MRTIFLVLQREYLVRVKKKSFIVMTLLTPILMSAIWLLPVYLAMRNTDLKKVQVIDDSKRFASVFKSTNELKFEAGNLPLEKAKKEFTKSGYDVLVYIPADIMENPKSLKLYAEKNVSLGVQNGIEDAVEQEIENQKLLQAGIDRKVLESTKVKVTADTYNLSDEGEKDSSSGAATALGYLFAFAIYFTIFLYGAQVMRGVLEEKTNRIVEVIISSVKPFQLMAGKIIGVALVGLTQFLLWILLTFGLSSALSAAFGPDTVAKMGNSSMYNQPGQAANGTTVTDANAPAVPTASPATANVFSKAKAAVSTLDWTMLLVCFGIYFVGGYLLYSALFAAVGAAVDNETDVQQFMFPITIPLILAFIMAQFVIREPDGPIAFWFSMIPFTSPVIMMVRVPFGVPLWEIALSVALLIGGFIGVAWVAARIYRVGILMYGKKPTFAELSKWIFYKA
ncbi:ABC transporter permease [Rudanella paleaurantiibacter]|uniref:ABC transporter permease n=1 Tax=Rudanella paleaurantiibacter TaxID=2614655 RepID=A0A7J5U4E9_9BACT|nr:ABC transporter permease [Rudanella paleaurantiibacter]KAB7732722.1 ABC transporter permease [Rudanella paleaurantiibacter]